MNQARAQILASFTVRRIRSDEVLLKEFVANKGVRM